MDDERYETFAVYKMNDVSLRHVYAHGSRTKYFRSLKILYFRPKKQNLFFLVEYFNFNFFRTEINFGIQKFLSLRGVFKFIYSI
jgi:hypothetical protein